MMLWVPTVQKSMMQTLSSWCGGNRIQTDAKNMGLESVEVWDGDWDVRWLGTVSSTKLRPPARLYFITDGAWQALGAPRFLDNHSWASSQNAGLVGLIWTQRWGLFGWHKNIPTGYNRIKSFINWLSKVITQSQSFVRSDGFNPIRIGNQEAIQK